MRNCNTSVDHGQCCHGTSNFTIYELIVRSKKLTEYSLITEYLRPFLSN